MTHQIELPEEVRQVVADIGAVVTPDEVDVYRNVQEITDKSYKLHTVVAAWEGQQNEERKLRSGYAKWLLVALSAQMVVVNVVFFLLAVGVLVVAPAIANAFIIGVFAEIAGMTLIVVKYLFPEAGSQVAKLIEKL